MGYRYAYLPQTNSHFHEFLFGIGFDSLRYVITSYSIHYTKLYENTLSLQEAKDSSAIENIITTHDDLYKSELNLDAFKSLEAKEVQNYISALKKGFELTRQSGLLTNKTISEIQEALEDNKAGFRKLPGTALKNASTGETIYTPPQDYDEIIRLMSSYNFV